MEPKKKKKEEINTVLSGETVQNVKEFPLE